MDLTRPPFTKPWAIPNECGYCGRQYVHPGNLRRHLATHPAPEPWFSRTRAALKRAFLKAID